MQHASLRFEMMVKDVCERLKSIEEGSAVKNIFESDACLVHIGGKKVVHGVP